MSLIPIEAEKGSTLLGDEESPLGGQGLSAEQAIRLLACKCVEVGSIPFGFDPEWVIDDSLPHNRKIVEELASRGLRGNDLLLARKEIRERMAGSEAEKHPLYGEGDLVRFHAEGGKLTGRIEIVDAGGAFGLDEHSCDIFVEERGFLRKHVPESLVSGKAGNR